MVCQGRGAIRDGGGPDPGRCHARAARHARGRRGPRWSEPTSPVFRGEAFQARAGRRGPRWEPPSQGFRGSEAIKIRAGLVRQRGQFWWDGGSWSAPTSCKSMGPNAAATLPNPPCEAIPVSCRTGRHTDAPARKRSVAIRRTVAPRAGEPPPGLAPEFDRASVWSGIALSRGSR